MKFKENKIFTYLKRLLSKWWISLALIPSILGTFNFYFKLPGLILTWQSSLILFSILFLIANYLIWKEESEERTKLQERLKEIDDKKPKLKLTFKDEQDKITIKNNLVKRRVDSSIINKSIEEQLKIDNFRGYLLSSKFPTPDFYEDLYKEFEFVEFELHNIGDVKATNVRIKLEFPRAILVSEELPEKPSFFGRAILPSMRKRNFGEYKSKDNEISLWDNESLHPDITLFEPFFISARKKGKYKIKYVINCEELDAKGIKGELIISAKPKEELLLYPGEETIRQDKEGYETLLREALNYG